jgi:hypothetical protein
MLEVNNYCGIRLMILLLRFHTELLVLSSVPIIHVAAFCELQCLLCGKRLYQCFEEIYFPYHQNREKIFNLNMEAFCSFEAPVILQDAAELRVRHGGTL